MPITLPTAPFDKTKAIFSRKTYAVYTDPTGPTVTTFIGKMSELDAKLTVVPLKQPDAKGVNRVVRNAPSEAEESYSLTDMEDVGTIVSFFGGGLTSMKTGTVQIFIVDPSDAAGFCRLVSDVFACSVMRDGNIKFGDANWAKNPTLKFISEKGSEVVWTPNQAVV